MPPPSELVIATKAVERLVKEEAYYHAELAKQEERVRKLTADIATSRPEDLDPNADYVLRQETRAAEETKAVFAPLKLRTQDAVAKLEEQIAFRESSGAAADTELEKARAILRTGQTAIAKED
ncbi:tubulin-specific chaperone [Grosmannia clavigera kw1407]|uniref:Tubulin-specific chaperone A n=1 Tax=Grosmannia clavigera (strain kw1407 / UAMH 11150) TaxID=655863 RepID=F0XRJ1_GROCL|nr:tubulin-specific chaperone [Grosmannia clavigera kw1407]EFW99840.1 tubulin-specific chaperone [Grosmannia clavigera kw1407]